MEVVSASHGVLGPLLGKLAKLLTDECGRLKGVRDEIRWLQTELMPMHAAVQMYTTLQDLDVHDKEWVSLVRELAYDIEDVIDTFVHELNSGGNQGSGFKFKKFFHEITHRCKTLGPRHEIANKIENLKPRVKQVKELKSSYKLNDIVCGTTERTTVDPLLAALFTEEKDLVGIEGPREDLIKWMLEDNISFKHRKVLSIVGFGGIGKTTLANQVYRHITRHFQCHAFVSVSQKSDEKRIFKEIIMEITSQVPCQKDFKEDIDTWDKKKYIMKLKELLQDKRYLILVDDIWSVRAWNSISFAFPMNNHSSRIMTTTRKFDVAKSCCPNGDDRLYKMKGLSEVHSKRLFFNRIFGSEDDCPSMLKDVANEILRKCGGLPLAITSLSGLLATKPFVKDVWEKVQRSVGSAMDKSGSLKGMSSILSLSYHDLPPYLKTCLLYLSMIPEDTIYDRENLVLRWIAEGFISEERGCSRQEVAEGYFYELINRNIVQPVDIGVDGKVSGCRVHDMMLELIISKSTEENFITVIGGGQTVLAPKHGYIRRLSVQYMDQELASVLTNQELSHVRALIMTASNCTKYMPSLVEFESLRVLDFGHHGIAEEYDMKDIGKLIHLKYLNFRHSRISNIPAGIVMLHNLETLDLRNTFIDMLPARIIQLTKLENLFLPRGYWSGGWQVKIPDGIGNMKKLRVIKGFNITKSSVGAVEELGNLDNLEVLKVQLDSRGPQELKMHEEMLLSSLSKLGSCKLKYVWIRSSNSAPLQFLDYWSPLPLSLQRFRMTTDYSFPKSPKWIVPALTSLTYLDINLEIVTEEDLCILGEIPGLLSLVVKLFSVVQKERLTVRRTGFSCLKEFYLKDFDGGAIYLTFEEGALPKLEKLKLPLFVSIAKSYGLYLGIGHLTCLRYAKIILCNKVDTSSESRDAEAAIMKEANSNPNHPRVIVLDNTEVKEDNEEEVKEES